MESKTLDLEDSMFNLATGKVFVEEIKSVLDPSSGKIIRLEKLKRQLPPNPALQMFLAQKLMPKKYGDTSDDGLGDW